MLDKEAIVSTFAEHDISLHPAGVWKFDGEGKKEPIIPFRADRLPLSSYPKDNMFKLRIEETQYMVIDVDEPSAEVLQQLYTNLPSIKKTLTSTTTRETKQHIYIVKPDEYPYTRVVGALKNVDLLSNGIVFEGHLYDVNKALDIENRDTIVTLTEPEVNYLLSLVPKNVGNTDGPKVMNKRFNPAESKMIDEYLDDTLTDDRNLWKMLTPKDQHKQGKSNYKLPDLAYDTFNTLAFYVALNEYTPHEKCIKFMEKLLTKEYNVDLNSKQTYKRFYKQIVPTLPVYEIDDKNDNIDAHISSAPISRDGQFLLTGTVDVSGNLKYVLLDKYTHVPQIINDTMMRSQKAVQYMYPTLDANMWTYGIPMIELTGNPYKAHKTYDFNRRVFTLSTLKPTQYLLECGESEKKPQNILTKAIANIFKTTKEHTSSVDPEDFYYHWLAHIIFSNKQMSTILSLSTDSTVQGGTGKSTFTAKLPMHILPIGTVFTVDEGTAQWGDAFHNSKLTCFDDLHDSDKWKSIYATMKRETSGTISKKNIKGKGTQISNTSACLSISSNFLPKIDETDRRFFIWGPTQKLSEEEGLRIAKIMSDFNAYHEEIQEIVSYCKYLFNNYEDKYSRELYIEAPKTSFNSQAKTEGATSKKLLSLILSGPDALFDSFVPNKKILLNHREVVDFILGQVGEPSARSNQKHTVQLPQDFCTMLLNATRDEDILNESPRNISLSLGCTFTSIAVKFQGYRKISKFKTWKTRGVILPIEEDTINKYKSWLKYNTPVVEEIQEKVDV